MSNKSALIILVKNPILGKVKTRLAATIGDEKALDIYIQLLDKTRRITEQLAVDKFVYYDQEISQNDIWDARIFQKALQLPIGFGERIKQAFSDTFEQGYERICIIGSDCWQLTQQIIEKAFEKLFNHDVVMGPSTDGGYYLLGMKKHLPFLFDNKQWSTFTVSKDTWDDCYRHGLSCYLLDELTDIDTEEDLVTMETKKD
jgi:uncharacterized protein